MTAGLGLFSPCECVCHNSVRCTHKTLQVNEDQRLAAVPIEELSTQTQQCSNDYSVVMGGTMNMLMGVTDDVMQ